MHDPHARAALVVPDSLKHRLPEMPPRRKRFVWLAVALVVVLTGVVLIAFKALVWSEGPASATCLQLDGQTDQDKAATLSAALADLQSEKEVEAFVADLFAGCQELMPRPEDRPSLAPLAAAPPSMEFQTGSGVSPSDRDTAQEWAESAEGIIARYAGGHLWSLSVFADIDPAALAGELTRLDTIPSDQAYDLVSQGYVGGLGAVFLNLASIPLTVPDGYVAIAHEVAHAYQAWLSWPTSKLHACVAVAFGIRPSGPRWLGEGTAEVLAWQAFIDSPYLPATETAEDYHRRLLDSAYQDFDGGLRFLATDRGWETYGADSPAYTLSYAAVSLLEEQAGRTALFDYWRNLGRGQCWEAAFNDAFGLTPDRFYDLFEEQRP